MDIREIIDYTPNEAWISPDGKFYNGEGHDYVTELILEKLYHVEDEQFPGDKLEQLGWIKVTTSLMWEIRNDTGYFDGRVLTKKQYKTLTKWCHKYGKDVPTGIVIEN